MNEQSKNTIIGVVAVIVFMCGGFVRGAFGDKWFGDLLGYSVSAIAFLLWGHRGKYLWPEGGLPEWEDRRRAGFLRHMRRGWIQFGLSMGVVLCPALYIFHLIFDAAAHTTSLFNHIKVSLAMGIAVGVLLGVWAWLDCELIYRAELSKSKQGSGG